MKFNRKYQRSGALIESRYKSKAVEVDEYFIPLIIYIHQNPQRAGLVKKLEEYKYSSYREYLGENELVETSLSVDMLGKKEWIKAHQQIIENTFEVEGRKKLSGEEIRQKILKITNNIVPAEIERMEKEERNKILKALKNEGLSIRELERATGIARGIIAKS